MSLAVGARYARALAEIAFAPESKDDPDRLLQELRQFAAELKESRPLRDVLASPAVTRQKKQDLIEKLAERMELSNSTRNFLVVVSRRGRMGILSSIADAFQSAIDEHRGVAAAEVVSATDLDDAQRAGFEQRVAAITGKKARLTYRVDPAILGGAVLRVGSSVYDGSVAGKLNQMSATLAAGA